ncbi:hypothetical protein BGW80DRAFT_74636 [Lactifluus volemus]|nr:hypothetical protein BGW80DRAFT_74636 [Lactifluus volemus]
MPTNLSIPEDFVLDVHNLASIILDAHTRTEVLFPNAQLLEVNRGDKPLFSLPSWVLPPQWHLAAIDGQQHVLCVLKSDSHAAERTTIDTFTSPEGVMTSDGRELTRRDIEDIFWRCKTFNSGYLLAYVAQRVFDSLPPTASLRVRTSAKHEIVCKPSDVMIAEIDILPKEAFLIIDYEPRPDVGPTKLGMTRHLSGFSGVMPWVFLVIGEPKATDVELDTRVVFDLVTAQIGGRGGGEELFSLERAFDYHSKVLPEVADDLEPWVLSGKMRIKEHDIRAQGDALVEMVMDRLRKIANGQDDFCWYCGTDGVDTRCSKCKTAHFCRSCQLLGWKYHKVWCKSLLSQ